MGPLIHKTPTHSEDSPLSSRPTLLFLRFCWSELPSPSRSVAKPEKSVPARSRTIRSIQTHSKPSVHHIPKPALRFVIEPGMLLTPQLVQAVTIACLLHVCLSLPIFSEPALVDRDTSAIVSMNPQSNNAQDLRHSWDFIPSSGSEPLIHGTLHVRASDFTRESSASSSSLSSFIKQETPPPYIAPAP
ncbi:hypothetical protein H0H93_012964, partial [Arthromyces matolae]